MIKIRQGFFETNSSSTHSMVMLGDVEREKLEKKELMISITGKLIETAETRKSFEKWLAGYDDKTRLDIIERVIRNDSYPDRDFNAHTREENMWFIYIHDYQEYSDTIKEWLNAPGNYNLEYNYSLYKTSTGENIEAHSIFGMDY